MKLTQSWQDLQNDTQRDVFVLTTFCLCLTAFLTVIYLPFLIGLSCFYQSDLSYSFEPICRYLGENLRAGHWPVWNPLLACGVSQIAMPSPSMFYPLNWLFVLRNFSRDLAAYCIIHSLIAAAGMFWLIRKFGFSRLAAVCAALIAALNGYMYSAPNTFTLMATAAWVPAVALGIYSLSGTGSRLNARWFTFAALACAMMLLAGRVEIFACAVGIALLYAAVCWWISYDNGQGRAALPQLLWRIAAIACGILLAMPMLAPTIEWWQTSYRAEGLEPAHVLDWSANWYDWLSVALVQPLGSLMGDSSPFLPYVSGRRGAIQLVPSAYIGTIVITLAALGLVSSRWKGRWVFLGVGLATAFIASGSNIPGALYLVTYVQALSLLRYPIKLIIFPLLCAAVLAAAGLDALLLKCVSRRVALATAAFWCAVLCGGLLIWRSDHINTVFLAIPLGATHHSITELLYSLQGLIGKSITSGALLVMGVCIVLVIHCYRPMPTAFLSSLICASVGLQLLTAAVLYPPESASANYFQQGSYIAAAVRSRLYGPSGIITQRLLPLYIEAVNKVQSQPNQSADEARYRYTRSMLFANQALDFHLPIASGYEVSESANSKRLFDTVAILSSPAVFAKPDPLRSANDFALYRYCKAAAVQYVSTQAKVGIPERLMPSLDARVFVKETNDLDHNFTLYRVRDTNPRVYFARNVTYVDDWRPYVASVLDPSPRDPLNDVYLARRNGQPPATVEPYTLGTASDLAKIDKESPEYVHIKVQTNAPRLLVLADSYYPGWKATLDGKDAYIYRANMLYRAVAVPKGQHVIEFRLEPDSERWGTLLWSLGVVAIIVVYFRLGKQAPPRSD
jgi:hypothetical protein